MEVIKRFVIGYLGQNVNFEENSIFGRLAIKIVGMEKIVILTFLRGCWSCGCCQRRRSFLVLAAPSSRR